VSTAPASLGIAGVITRRRGMAAPDLTLVPKPTAAELRAINLRSNRLRNYN
jgi:hypothetical protein